MIEERRQRSGAWLEGYISTAAGIEGCTAVLLQATLKARVHRVGRIGMTQLSNSMYHPSTKARLEGLRGLGDGVTINVIEGVEVSG
jgi:hypothetical protein